MCKLAKIKIHPARMSPIIPEFFIKFLTNEKDIVLDPFAGSNTTGDVAEILKRKNGYLLKKMKHLHYHQLLSLTVLNK